MAPSLKRCIWMTINHHKPTNLEPNLSRRHPKTFTAHHSEVQAWCKFKRHLSIPGSRHKRGSRFKFNWVCVSQTHQSQNVWYQSMESIPISRYQWANAYHILNHAAGHGQVPNPPADSARPSCADSWSPTVAQHVAVPKGPQLQITSWAVLSFSSHSWRIT